MTQQKYASYLTPSLTPTWGVEVAGTLYDLGKGGTNLAPSLKAAIADGVFGNGADTTGAPGYAIEDVQFLPPITDPGKILCIGVNYHAHRAETGRKELQSPPTPTVFTRFADTQMGHLRPARMPRSTTQFDYEGELAVVIGKPAFRVAEQNAADVIAGYSIYNDFSVRDWQRATTQWTPGKNFPETGGFGPYLVPASAISDVGALKLETRVNGEVRQSASISDLVFSIPQIVAHLTGFTPLAPGDVVVTGTPGGVGLFMDPPGLLNDGDLVEVEITCLGVLTNPVALES